MSSSLMWPGRGDLLRINHCRVRGQVWPHPLYSSIHFGIPLLCFRDTHTVRSHIYEILDAVGPYDIDSFR